MPAALFLGWRSALVKDCQEGGLGLTCRPSFKTCDRRSLASFGLHGGSPAKCGRCSAAEVVSGCGLVVRKGVISHHFMGIEESRAAASRAFSEVSQVSLGPFHIVGRLVVCPSLLGPLGGRVAMQLVGQMLFNRALNWVWPGVCLYKAGVGGLAL